MKPSPSPVHARLVGFLSGCLALVLAGPASAGTIDFNIFLPPSGTIFYDGLGGALMGSDIAVDTVTGNGTPDHAATYACIGCVLAFETGNFIEGDLSGWVFGATNLSSFISVTGSVDTDGDSIGDLPLLMSGDFIGPQINVELGTVGLFDFGVTVGFFVDSLNPELTGFFGTPSSPYVGGFALGWVGIANPPGAIVGTATQGVVRNTALVPEPTTCLLLGLGLAGLGATRRRRV